MMMIIVVEDLLHSGVHSCSRISKVQGAQKLTYTKMTPPFCIHHSLTVLLLIKKSATNLELVNLNSNDFTKPDCRFWFIFSVFQI